MAKKILVTGGAGFIGSHTVDELLTRGYEVRILDSLQPRVHPKGVPSYIPREVELCVGDVANRADVEKSLEGVEGVFHLAAYQDYLQDFSTFIHTNTESTALLFELINEKKLPVRKIVFASSQSVAGEGKYFCSEHGIIFPDQRPIEQLQQGQWELKCPHCGREMEPQLIDEAVAMPHTAYGVSKFAIEHLARALGKKFNIPTACMRYTYVQGTRNSFYNAYSGIARISALRLLHGKPPLVFEDGLQQRDFINVGDVARANVVAYENNQANHQVLNVGGGVKYTVLDFAKMIIKVFGKEGELEPLLNGEFRVGDTRHTVSDNSKMEALGWQQTKQLEETLTEYRDYMSNFGDEIKAYFEQAEAEMRQKGIIQAVKTDLA